MEKKIYSRPVMDVEIFTPNHFCATCEEPVPGVKISAYWDVVNDSGYSTILVHDGAADNICMPTKEYIEPDGKVEATGSYNIKNGWYFNKTIYSYRNGAHPGGRISFNDSGFSPVTGYENATVYVRYHVAYIFKERPSDDIIDMGTNYDPTSPAHKTMS